MLVERITGEVLANKLKEMLVKYGLDLGNCRGQGYDDASNMSGESGVQGRLLQENPKAHYIHCNSHVLYCPGMYLTDYKKHEWYCDRICIFFANSHEKRQTFLESN